VVTEHKELQEVLAQINIIPFKRSHINMLHEMLESQDFDPKGITYESLPKIGYIAMLGDQPIAAGFLRRVECDIIAQIDGLVSNKMFGSVIRHEGISKIVDTLIMSAKSLKLQGLIAFTTDITIIKRAEVAGFLKINHSVLSLTF
jgi:hypothetical protein